jgi:hypothetical protein
LEHKSAVNLAAFMERNGMTVQRENNVITYRIVHTANEQGLTYATVRVTVEEVPDGD